MALALILDWGRKGPLARTSLIFEPDFRGFGVCSNSTPKTIATQFRIILSIEPGAENILPPPKLRIG